MEIASFKEYHRPDSRPIGRGEPLNIKNQARIHF
jgi:hypothetical protein